MGRKKIEQAAPVVGGEVVQAEPTAIQPVDQKSAELATALGEDNPISPMLMKVLDGKIDEGSVAALERLVGLWERVDSKNAERAFAAAFAALQADLRPVKAMRPVKNNDGTLRYVFAPFEDIMESVAPSLHKHGFSLTFSMRWLDGGRCCAICTLTHSSGHSRLTEFSARAGKGPPGSSDTQADGAVMTYTKRFALCNALNIVIDKDTDARAEGETISADEAAALQAEAVEVTGGDAGLMDLLFRLAGAPSFAEMRTGKLAVVRQQLDRMKKGPRAAPKPPAAKPQEAHKPEPDAPPADGGDRAERAKEFRNAVKAWTGLHAADVPEACHRIASIRGVADLRKADALTLRDLTQFVVTTKNSGIDYIEWVRNSNV